jgi:hypothetical protein
MFTARCLAMESPLPIVGQEFFFAGKCLPSCSLASDIYVTIPSQDILLFFLARDGSLSCSQNSQQGQEVFSFSTASTSTMWPDRISSR